MLAALLFATDDADDSPEMLAATLPYSGATLIEFQARLVLEAGAGQIAIVVGRMTPELLGAINRIMKRGAAVDVVRSAREAVEKLHPLARVVVMADGLVTTQGVLETLVGEGQDALLVTPDSGALPGLERVGVDAIWAGLARLSMRRIAEVASLPRDYDFQSSLLRVAAQGGAAHVPLPAGPARSGHGVEHSAAQLRRRNEALLAGHVSGQPAWFDRYLVAPVARRLLPLLVARAAPAGIVGGTGAFALALGLGCVAMGWLTAGLLLALAAGMVLSMGATLSWMRDERRPIALQQGAISLGVAALVGLTGLGESRAAGTASAAILATALVILAAFAERASEGRRRRWWASPPAYLLVLVPFVAAEQVVWGLGAGAVYAALTLGAAIEALRKQP